MSDDPDLEELLRRYEPLAPPAALRDRVMGSSQAGAGWRSNLPWLAVAASLTLWFALHDATARVEERLTRFDMGAREAQALLESQQVPELAIAGLVRPYAPLGSMPRWRWPETALPEGEQP